MKDILRLAAALLLALSVLGAARGLAAGFGDFGDMLEGQREAFDIDSVNDALSADAKKTLGKLGVDGAGDLDLSEKLSFKKVMGLVLSAFFGSVGRYGVLFVSIAGVVLILSLFESLKSAYQNKSLDTVFAFVGGAAICSLIYQPFYGAADGLANAVGQAGDFMKALIPVFTALMASSGNAGGAAVFSAMLFLAVQLAAGIASGIMLPLVNLYMAAGVAASVSGNVNLKHVTAFLRTVVLWGTGLLLTVFSGVLALQSIVAGAADSVAKRSVKFAVSSLIPVAGGQLGDAVDAMFASARMLKSALGVFGIVAVFVILLSPFLVCAANYLIVKLGSLLSAVSGNEQATSVLEVMREGFGMVLGICAALCVMFLFALALAVVSTGGT